MKTQIYHVAFARKPYDLDDVRDVAALARPSDRERVTIAEVVTLTAAEYDAFTADFIQALPWLSGKGGLSGSLLVRAPGRDTLVVNPEGYDYAKYVAVV